jgi:hypothetical protein
MPKNVATSVAHNGAEERSGVWPLVAVIWYRRCLRWFQPSSSESAERFSSTESLISLTGDDIT